MKNIDELRAAMDDFFQKIGGKIDELRAAADAQQKLKDDNQTFVRETIPFILPEVAKFAQRLGAKYIDYDLTPKEEGLTLALRWADRQAIVLEIGKEQDFGFLTYRISDNSPYSRNAADGPAYSRESWTMESLHEQLRALAERYLAEAGEHGGISNRPR